MRHVVWLQVVERQVELFEMIELAVFDANRLDVVAAEHQASQVTTALERLERGRVLARVYARDILE